MPIQTSLLAADGALAAPQADLQHRTDGSIVLRNSQRLQPFVRCIGDWLDHWATIAPRSLFLAERAGSGDWRRLDYYSARQQVGCIAQGLLNLDLPQNKPVVIVSDNAIDHALLSLAAMYVGRSTCSVSSAYARLNDHSKLHGILDLLDPALVYAGRAVLLRLVSAVLWESAPACSPRYAIPEKEVQITVS